MSFLHHWHHVYGAHTHRNLGMLYESPTFVTDVMLTVFMTGGWQNRCAFTCSDIQRIKEDRQLNESWQTWDSQQRRRWGFKSAGLWRYVGVPRRFGWSYCLRLYISSTQLPHELFLDFFFCVLLTVHLSITLANNQLDAKFLYFIIRLLQSSTCFAQRCAHHQEVRLY